VADPVCQVRDNRRSKPGRSVPTRLASRRERRTRGHAACLRHLDMTISPCAPCAAPRVCSRLRAVPLGSRVGGPRRPVAVRTNCGHQDDPIEHAAEAAHDRDGQGVSGDAVADPNEIADHQHGIACAGFSLALSGSRIMSIKRGIAAYVTTPPARNSTPSVTMSMASRLLHYQGKKNPYGSAQAERPSDPRSASSWHSPTAPRFGHSLNRPKPPRYGRGPCPRSPAPLPCATC
jgi:hypothetical protein